LSECEKKKKKENRLQETITTITEGRDEGRHYNIEEGITTAISRSTGIIIRYRGGKKGLVIREKTETWGTIDMERKKKRPIWSSVNLPGGILINPMEGEIERERCALRLISMQNGRNIISFKLNKIIYGGGN